MFQKAINYFIYWTVSVCLLAPLTACNKGQTLENLLGADPQLQKQTENNNTTTEKPEAETKTSETKTSTLENTNKYDNANNSSPADNLETLKINLPANFPQVIPLYSQAELLEVDSATTATNGKTTWRSPDNSVQIASFYQQQFQADQWEILQAFPSDSQAEKTLIAIKDNLEVVIYLQQIATERENNSASTEFTIEYRPTNSLTQQPLKDLASESTTNNSSSDIINTESNSESIAAIHFSDLDEAPEQLRQYVKDVAALGVLTPYQPDGKVGLNEFAPNEPVMRRDYARWLVDINNHFYADSSGNKIHLATKIDRPAFKDIGVNDPDYAVIQGLAEAGLIPSRLTNNSNKLLFQPDAPLTREDLITWKVPLDLRQALPTASIEAISESWGFQDVTNIDPQGLQALFADFQNGEQANIKRVFGYTTLFQPKKPVTRAEAASSLWYLGFQGDGINAQEALKLQEN